MIENSEFTHLKLPMSQAWIELWGLQTGGSQVKNDENKDNGRTVGVDFVYTASWKFEKHNGITYWS